MGPAGAGMRRGCREQKQEGKLVGYCDNPGGDDGSLAILVTGEVVRSSQILGVF